VSLFISNFNKMNQAIILCIILFILYNVFLLNVRPNVSMLQNQRQNNHSIAQDLMYEYKGQSIIVGSSMAARMKNEFLPDNYYNLSFSGGSALTGLEIIKRSGIMPPHIYIENNTIFREVDSQLLKTLFNPFSWEIKKYIPALREKYQPLNLVISKLQNTYGKTHNQLLAIKKNNQIYDVNIERQKTNYNKILKPYDIQLKQLKNLVKYFDDNGAIIIFFEMPIDASLASSPKAREQRLVIKSNFEHNWIKLPNNKYTTADGIHLIYKSAYEYSNEFIQLTRGI